MKECIDCGKDLIWDEDKFCPKCGGKNFSDKNTRCRFCNSRLAGYEKFCTACGERLKEEIQKNWFFKLLGL